MKQDYPPPPGPGQKPHLPENFGTMADFDRALAGLVRVPKGEKPADKHKKKDGKKPPR